MVDFITAWAVISTLGAGFVGRAWYRRAEIEKLARIAYAAGIQIHEAAKDGDVTETEFQGIADTGKLAIDALGAVLYKK